MVKDGLVIIKEDGIFLTEICQDLTQNIRNIFDKYVTPNHTDNERRDTRMRSKKAQADILERL